MNQKHIYVTRAISSVGLDMLRAKGYAVDVGSDANPPSARKVLRQLRRKPYDAVLTLLTDQVDAAFLDAAPQAKIIANYAVGFNNIDLAEAKKRGVTVTNTPGASSEAVAEHAVGLMLALCNRIAEGDRFVRKGKYRGWLPMGFLGSDLRGSTIGLVGVGGIGSVVARIATKGFGAQVIYHDVNQNAQVEADYGATRAASLEELLRRADIVSLHVPLLPSTHHLIDAARLKLMKKSAFLINTARGPVVDEAALVDALAAKTIAGAALDVFEFEPKLSRGLASLDNVVLTPHIASARPEARDDMSRVAAQGIIDFFEGKVPTNKVA